MVSNLHDVGSGRRSSILAAAVAVGMTFSFASVASGLEPLDIAPAYFEFESNTALSSGGAWSGLTYDDGFLYAVDEGSTKNLKKMTTAGAHVDSTEITGIDEPEGLTHVSGDQFAIVDEETGIIYLFDMDVALGGGTFNLATGNDGEIDTGLGSTTSDGPEGLAYDAISDSFFVAKEKGTGRGIYLVENTTTNPDVDFLFDPGASDLSGLFLAGKYLYIVSDLDEMVFRYSILDLESPLEDPQFLDLNADKYEGIAVDPSGELIYVVRDENVPSLEFLTYELPVDDYDFNLDGSFTAEDIDELFAAVGGMDLSFDMDGDLDVDLDDADVYIKDFLYTYYGDANLDREFGTGDIVLVTAAGEYEDGDNDNSTWAEGDWTGDFDYTSADNVKAFQDGGWELGPRL
jgi:uncharacterized protein YjiK